MGFEFVRPSPIPVNTLPVASVTRKGDSWVRTINHPFPIPHTAPAANARTIASTTGTRKLTMRPPTRTAASPPMPPMERFMPPDPMVTSWANATTALTETACASTPMLVTVRKLARKTVRTTHIRTMLAARAAWDDRA